MKNDLRTKAKMHKSLKFVAIKGKCLYVNDFTMMRHFSF